MLMARDRHGPWGDGGALHVRIHIKHIYQFYVYTHTHIGLIYMFDIYLYTQTCVYEHTYVYVYTDSEGLRLVGSLKI